MRRMGMGDEGGGIGDGGVGGAMDSGLGKGSLTACAEASCCCSSTTCAACFASGS